MHGVRLRAWPDVANHINTMQSTPPAINKQEKPAYFLQIASFTDECIAVRLDVLEKNKKTITYDICDCSNRNILARIKIQKNKLFKIMEIENEDIEIDGDLFEMAVYDKKGDEPLSNIVKLMKFPESEEYPFNNYKPQAIATENIVKVVDEANNKLFLYWHIPLNTFGDTISYKIVPFADINDDDDDKEDCEENVNISIIPYVMPLSDAPEIFSICTVSEMDDTNYYSALSAPINIGTIKLKTWCTQNNLSNIYCKLIENEYECLSKIAELSPSAKKLLCNKIGISSLDRIRFLKNLPRISLKNRKRMLRNVDFTVDNEEIKENVTLLLVGKTGEGKSTTINNMMNYLFDTEFEGDRYRLIVENPDKKKKTTQSQTEEISVYHIQPIHPDIHYNVTIVDTPGFANCDDRGRQFDEEIGKQLQELFETKVKEINAICLVMRAGITRLTEEESYVFSQVIDKFAKNVADNIILLFTFDDGSRPPIALSAVNETANIKHRKKYFAFNNRGFQFDEKEIDYSKQAQFSLAMEVFAQFFKEITVPQPQSLCLSAKQLKQKAQLRDIINEFSEQLDEMLTVCYVVAKRIKELRAQYGDGNRTIAISHAVKKKERVRNQQGVLEEFYVCNKCESTVRQGWFQSAFGFAPQCYEGHFASKEKYRYALRRVEKKVNVEDTDKMLAVEASKLKQMERGLIELICVIKNEINDIKEIALNSSTLSISQYFAILIEEAEHSGKQNSFEKLKVLQYLQQQTELIGRIDKETESIDIQAMFIQSQ